MSIDGLSDEELSFLLDDEDESSPEEKKTKKKKRSPVVPIVLLVVALVGGLLYVNAQGDNTPAPPVEKKPEEVSLQLVNLQQVSWADNICTTISAWDDDGLVKPMKGYEKPAFILKARNDMVKNLKYNAKQIKKMASDVSNLPEKVHEDAVYKEREALVVDNYRKVGNSVDKSVGESSRNLAASMQGYASALEELATSMQRVADYNFDGMRGSIDDTNKTLEGMKTQFSDDVRAALPDDFFDNTMTMEAISNLESCNGDVINRDALYKERGKEIKDQGIISDFVVMERCQQFLDNMKRVSNPSENAQLSADACQEFLSTTTVDANNPLVSGKVNSFDDERVKPEVDNEAGDTPQDSHGEITSETTKGDTTQRDTPKSQ